MAGRKLAQSVIAGGRYYAAGTPEGDVEADVPDKFWDGQAATSDATGYDDLKVDERRNEGREEADQIPSDGKKADLIAALDADDEA